MAQHTFTYRAEGTLTFDDTALKQAFIGIRRHQVGPVGDDQVLRNDEAMLNLSDELPTEQLVHDVVINAIHDALSAALSNPGHEGLQVEVDRTGTAEG